MSARLPPLNAVRAFEAAARHASFTRAAEELNVTHGAISRQVSLLESWLNTSLFRRLNRQVILTQAGVTLLSEVGPALSRITLATATLTSQAKTTVLTLNAPPTFTMRWLIPRLSSFLQRGEMIDIRLETSLKPVDFVAGGYDLAIRRARVAPPGLQSRIFLREMLIPICSRDYFERTQLKDAAQLQDHTLIHTATSPTAWAEWIASAGLEATRLGRSLVFEELFFTLQAATNGLGVAIAPAALVADDVAAGKLMFPFGNHHLRDYDYRLLLAPSAEKQAAISQFSSWIADEGRRSINDVKRLLSASHPSPPAAKKPNPA